jgi:hypothetical protein
MSEKSTSKVKLNTTAVLNEEDERTPSNISIIKNKVL